MPNWISYHDNRIVSNREDTSIYRFTLLASVFCEIWAVCVSWLTSTLFICWIILKLLEISCSTAKREFLRLFENILLIISEIYTEKKLSFPSLPAVTAKKWTSNFCYCKLHKFESCNCKPTFYSSTYSIVTGKYNEFQVWDTFKICKSYWQIIQQKKYKL